MTTPHNDRDYARAIPHMMIRAREEHAKAIVVFEYPYLENEIMLFVYGRDADLISELLNTQLHKGDDIPMGQFTCFPTMATVTIHLLANLLERPVYQYPPPKKKTSTNFSLN